MADEKKSTPKSKQPSPESIQKPLKENYLGFIPTGKPKNIIEKADTEKPPIDLQASSTRTFSKPENTSIKGKNQDKE